MTRRPQNIDPVVVAALTAIVREADAEFQLLGGSSSRSWVRDAFLPTLNRHGWFVAAIADVDDDSARDN